nr:MAG: putative RNA dependent RNA polymerase [Xinjiang mito-like virus 69]
MMSTWLTIFILLISYDIIFKGFPLYNKILLKVTIKFHRGPLYWLQWYWCRVFGKPNHTMLIVSSFSPHGWIWLDLSPVILLSSYFYDSFLAIALNPKGPVYDPHRSFFSKKKLFRDIYEAGAMISPSNLKHLKLVGKEIGWRIVFLSLLSTREPSRLRSLHNWLCHVSKINKHHGPTFCIKYLKFCQVAIQKRIAGQPFSSLREIEPDLPLPRLTKSGLPTFIKSLDRQAICSNSSRIIRLWLSLTSLYRVLEGPTKPKLSTITDPQKGDRVLEKTLVEYLEKFSFQATQCFSIDFAPETLGASVLKFFQTASPSSKVSWTGFIADYIALTEFEEFKSLYSSFMLYIQRTGSSGLLNAWRETGKLREMVEKHRYGDPTHLKAYESVPAMGELSFKVEPAGKLRVFAMVDVWTQSLLKPLHDRLYDLFKSLPNDGTWDQAGAFKRLSAKASISKNCYSYDLSAATDRLPISLQTTIINSITKSDLGNIWASLLVDRDYVVRKNSYGVPLVPLRYAVGQPMGALSSWGMLNLTHHMILQYCATLVHGPLTTLPVGSWWTDYEVLGDDIVIFDPEVASKYLMIMSDLGVDINLSKSLVSNIGVAEYAKRTVCQGLDVSPLSFKEFISDNTLFGRLNLVQRLMSMGWGKHYLRIFKIGTMNPFRRIDIKLPLIGALAQAVKLNMLEFELFLTLIVDDKFPLTFFGTRLQGFDKAKAYVRFRSIFEPESDFKNRSPHKRNVEFFLSLSQRVQTQIYLEYERLEKNVFGQWAYIQIRDTQKYFCIERDHVNPDGSITVCDQPELKASRILFTEFIFSQLAPDLQRDAEEISKYALSRGNYSHYGLSDLLQILGDMKKMASYFDLIPRKHKLSVLPDNPFSIIKLLEDSKKLRNPKRIMVHDTITLSDGSVVPSNILDDGSEENLTPVRGPSRE